MPSHRSMMAKGVDLYYKTTRTRPVRAAGDVNMALERRSLCYVPVICASHDTIIHVVSVTMSPSFCFQFHLRRSEAAGGLSHHGLGGATSLISTVLGFSYPPPAVLLLHTRWRS